MVPHLGQISTILKYAEGMHVSSSHESEANSNQPCGSSLPVARQFCIACRLREPNS